VTDSGQAEPRLAQALASYDGSPRAHADVLAALVGARVFVGITATSTAEHVDVGTNLRAESSAEMALVFLVAPDGERALPAFADTSAVQRWRLDVRPVPVTASYLARAALEDGASAVLLDPEGAGVVVPRAELGALAGGYVPVPGASLAARRTSEALTTPERDPDPLLVRALADAIRPERPRAARLLQGPSGLVLGIAPRAALDAAQLAELASRVMSRLGSALPSDGLDVAVVPPKGPGHAVLTRRTFTRRGR
jgi:hypothetical protein